MSRILSLSRPMADLFYLEDDGPYDVEIVDYH